MSNNSNTDASLKLRGIPKIIYRNHDRDVENKKEIESQFLSRNIVDYQRHSNKYHEVDYADWSGMILDKGLVRTPDEYAESLNIIDAIVQWYDSESSEVCIFTDDYVDLSLCDSWMFDWQFLYHHLPYIWDCIQLGVSSTRFIKMHLHPWIPSNKSMHCFMISRTFAKRLKKFHFIDGKYRLSYPSPNRSLLFTDYGLLDAFFYDIGITYTLPVFAPKVVDKHSLAYQISSDAIKYWWKHKSAKFSNFEFFHYNKGDKEWKMEVLFDTQGSRPEVYMDPMEGVLLWI